MALGITLSVGTSVLAERQQENSAGSTLPLDELRGLSEVFGRVKADYVEDVDDKTLIEGAIRGMLSSLDPHSAYLDREEFRELQVGTSGKFGGLGIEVTMEDGFVKVVAPIDDTPAMRAGVMAGDLVVRLDDTPVKGMSLNEAVSMMRGEPGTDITLTIVRDGTQKPLVITITRDIIKVQSVKSRLLDKGFGYLRITNFQSNTGEDVHKAVRELKKENEGALTGMVLDLRNNPGGVLGAAVSVSDAFLRKGKVVYTEGRAQDAKLDFNATPDDILDGAPLVVLINGGSASASEIVAGALQDHKRAIIMGTRSFGKGSVQTIFPMSNNSAVKITTARYFTPSGRSIQAEGIEPDIMTEAMKVARVEDNGVQLLREADLSRHLSNGNGDKPVKEQSKGDEEEKSLADSDYVLHEALNLLKGLSILQSRSGE
ncbi:MAG: S41 family peptidase [Gammaproteobacteria bacterium]|nr:S41 family peptidase [Gammaproteobacteria bacterium]